MGKTKRVATGEETVVLIPVIVEVVQVQVPLVSIAVQNRNVAVAVRIAPNIMRKIPSVPLPFEFSQG